MQFLARCVHRSFRKVENFADWLTGAAGPLFVCLCLALVSIGMWTFCECQSKGKEPSEKLFPVSCMFSNIAPSPPSVAKLLTTQSPAHITLGIGSAISASPWLTLRWLLSLFLCLFIVYNIGFHYYMAVREPPGSITEGLSEALGERRIGPGSELWWNRYRRRATKESILALQNEDTWLFTFQPASSSDADAERVEHSDDLWVQVKMCQKCPRIPLWKALASLPPELRAIEKQLRIPKRGEESSSEPSASPNRASGYTQDSTANDSVHYSVSSQQFIDHAARGESIEDIKTWLGSESDSLVPPPKPERAHHCSVCKQCCLKFDHHCPWLNQCVGVGNERYFVLFMVWLAIGCMVVVGSGWSVVRQSISFKEVSKARRFCRLCSPAKRWEYHYTPRVFPLLTFTLCAIMGFALAVMSIWQILIIGWGETSVENSDNGKCFMSGLSIKS